MHMEALDKLEIEQQLADQSFDNFFDTYEDDRCENCTDHECEFCDYHLKSLMED